MSGEIAYMLGIIGVGFLVNYTLRALPFLLFAGRDRELPRWVERLGGVISPIIIALLIVYAYSGSAWRTPWPYLAGAVTVALQIWKRNPLLSIVAGTALYMALLACCGCTTSTVRDLDGEAPELLMRRDGVYMGERRLDARKIVAALEDAEIPKSQAIHIRVDSGIRDLSASRTLMRLLAHGGYTRSVLVTEQHGDSANKSGDRYAGNERMARRDDVFFTVTRQSVRFGLLTPVGPDGVARCLAANGIGQDQQIRLCASAADYDAPEVRETLAQLERVLREAGYVRVKRCWMTDGKSAPAPRAARKGIRYKSSGEER